MGKEISFDSYDESFLQNLKNYIRQAQVQAAVSVNRELVLLYWQIGRAILLKQQQQQRKWGAKVVERLAKDLKAEFPDVRGFSRSNLLYMRAFAEAFPDETVVQSVLGKLTWSHSVMLLDKLRSLDERLWYAQKANEHGWSRSAMLHQIETGLHRRVGTALTNFDQTLPPGQSDLVKQILKSPYNFDFLGLTEEAQERDFEKALVEHIKDFLLEMGVGFSFLGSQYPLQVDDKDYRLDLLFYHVRLHCYVVIDLKMGEFDAQSSGQMAFYVAVVDDLLRSEIDTPTIGIILCKSKSRATVEYALRYLQHPIGVATYRLSDTLPESLQGNFPTIKQLETELNTVEVEVGLEIEEQKE